MISALAKTIPGRRRSRRLTTFASLLWLNLAMLPCTMAADAGASASDAHCPPATNSEHSGHGPAGATVSHTHQDSAEPAGQDRLDAVENCLSGGDCCELDDVLLSDAAKKPDRDGAYSPLSIVRTSGLSSPAGTAIGIAATGPPPLYAGAVRRHAFHCVYRD